MILIMFLLSCFLIVSDLGVCLVLVSTFFCCDICLQSIFELCQTEHESFLIRSFFCYSPYLNLWLNASALMWDTGCAGCRNYCLAVSLWLMFLIRVPFARRFTFTPRKFHCIHVWVLDSISISECLIIHTVGLHYLWVCRMFSFIQYIYEWKLHQVCFFHV